MSNNAKGNMDVANTRGYIMVINSNGERKRVKVEKYNKSQKINEDNTILNGFKYDLAWDLSHGFTEGRQAFENIEKVK